jgi:hypothetical protein
MMGELKMNVSQPTTDSDNLICDTLNNSILSTNPHAYILSIPKGDLRWDKVNHFW